jgi:hypothetical protein
VIDIGTPLVTGWFVSLPASMIAPSLKPGWDKGSFCAYRLDRWSSQNSSVRVQATAQHRAQITGEWIETETGEIGRARISPALRADLRKF